MRAKAQHSRTNESGEHCLVGVGVQLHHWVQVTLWAGACTEFLVLGDIGKDAL